MGRPINKRYFGSGNQIKVRAKIGNNAEGDGFIVSQRSTNKFKVTVGANTGICKVVNKSNGELAANEMIINVMTDGGIMQQATKLYNRVAIVEGNHKVKWKAMTPIIRKEWETSLNTIPNEKALKEDGTLKVGTGIRGTYATVANDGVIELTLIPMLTGSKILGPAGSDGIFTKTEKGDISCFFGVTSLERPLNDVLGLYESITLDIINDGEIVQTVELHEDGWYDEDGEMLEGTYIDEYTIQEATRVSFFTESGKEHKFVLNAKTEEDNVSIEVTVIDEYVEPEPEPEDDVSLTITIDTQPADVTVEEGADATFTVKASGVGDLVYKWEVSDDSGASWADVPGGSTDTLVIAETVFDDHNDLQYRVVVSSQSGAADSVTSTVATLTVTQ